MPQQIFQPRADQHPAGALCASIFATIITASLTGIWGLPGGPLLQAAAAIGALCLVGSFLAVLAKRRGRPGKAGFRSHVWLASIGTGLVLAHGAGGLLKPPATLFVLLLLLIGLGVWSRLQGARMMAQTFGEKRAGFAKPTPAVRAELAALIEQKQTLLAKLDPSANEALFSPQIRHWFSAPILALRYTKLATEESRIVGAAAGLPKIQARWRVVHRLAALALLAGCWRTSSSLCCSQDMLQTAAISIGFTLQLGIFERHVTPSPDDRSGTLYRL